ncbi:hypothetical protein RF11_08106 [Thelohanellus kitauei]|uniref:Uncharacterized protein n=1 Tax=Thelohanellus kitauei TaxID=669202 RepID=A0A0C2MIH9_THEKT|nr:hypothetical protein RF11_08106 [Thelohanellus kitauei]
MIPNYVLTIEDREQLTGFLKACINLFGDQKEGDRLSEFSIKWRTQFFQCESFLIRSVGHQKDPRNAAFEYLTFGDWFNAVRMFNKIDYKICLDPISRFYCGVAYAKIYQICRRCDKYREYIKELIFKAIRLFTGCLLSLLFYEDSPRSESTKTAIPAPPEILYRITLNCNEIHILRSKCVFWLSWLYFESNDFRKCVYYGKIFLSYKLYNFKTFFLMNLYILNSYARAHRFDLAINEIDKLDFSQHKFPHSLKFLTPDIFEGDTVIPRNSRVADSIFRYQKIIFLLLNQDYRRALVEYDSFEKIHDLPNEMKESLCTLVHRVRFQLSCLA